MTKVRLSRDADLNVLACTSTLLAPSTLSFYGQTGLAARQTRRRLQFARVIAPLPISISPGPLVDGCRRLFRHFTRPVSSRSRVDSPIIYKTIYLQQMCTAWFKSLVISLLFFFNERSSFRTYVAATRIKRFISFFFQKEKNKSHSVRYYQLVTLKSVSLSHSTQQ